MLGSDSKSFAFDLSPSVSSLCQWHCPVSVLFTLLKVHWLPILSQGPWEMAKEGNIAPIWLSLNREMGDLPKVGELVLVPEPAVELLWWVLICHFFWLQAGVRVSIAVKQAAWVYITQNRFWELEGEKLFELEFRSLIYGKTKSNYEDGYNQQKFCFVLFLAALGLRCCTWVFSSCGKRGLLFVAVRGLLIEVASLVAERGL